MSIYDNSVTIQNGVESSLVMEVKKKLVTDPILLEHKVAVHNQRVEVFYQEEMLCFAIRVHCVFLMWMS